MFIPYHTCDFLYLGYTDDIVNLLSVPMDTRINVENRRAILGKYKRREIAKQLLGPEVYIMRLYCTNFLGLNGDCSVKEYWSIIKQYLVCYGMKDVDLMWNKYDRLYDLNFYSSAYFGDLDSSERLLTMCFDFFNWFNLYTGNIKYDERYEQYADVALIDDGKKNS